jgi:hypothetical protein
MGVPPPPAPPLPAPLLPTPYGGDSPPVPAMADYSSDDSDATEPEPLAQPQFLSPPETAPQIRRSLGALTEVSQESQSMMEDFESRRPSRPIYLDNVSETSEQEETARLAAARSAQGQMRVKEYGRTQHGGLVRGVSEPTDDERRHSVFDVFGLANDANEVGNGCFSCQGFSRFVFISIVLHRINGILSYLVSFCLVLSSLILYPYSLDCLASNPVHIPHPTSALAPRQSPSSAVPPWTAGAWLAPPWTAALPHPPRPQLVTRVGSPRHRRCQPHYGSVPPSL